MSKKLEQLGVETENSPTLKQGLHWWGCVASNTGETVEYNPESCMYLIAVFSWMTLRCVVARVTPGSTLLEDPVFL